MLTCLSKQKVFDGELHRYQHMSEAINSLMTFAIFLPNTYARPHEKIPAPALYWLSGLTCTDENFCHKSGAFKVASELGLVIVCPDTSPRGSNYPFEHESYDLGSGAGFYVNATQLPWSKTYKMYDYIVEELPEFIGKHFDVSERRGISGHSMGGHGALVCGLRNPRLFHSISAFSPIANPTAVPWGQKAFSAYLGENREAWKSYDACELIATRLNIRHPLLVEQGDADEFIEAQLCPKKLTEVCDKYRHPLILNMRQGYDHSYYFVASFIEGHLRYHWEVLNHS